MPLGFKSKDWQSYQQEEKERIIEMIASDLMKAHPELFKGGVLSGPSSEDVEKIIRNAVLVRSDLVPPQEAESIVKSIVGQATGYGVLQEFFTKDAAAVTEVCINPSADKKPKVFYGMRGKNWLAEKQYFSSNEEVLRYCQKICEDAGRPFTEDAPIVDAWLRDGSRIAVNGFRVSPLGVSATIRKSPLTRVPLSLEKLVEYQTLPQMAADLLVDLIVKGRANLGVFGRTDSGKTTFLRSLGMHIDPADRTFIAETSFEMFMPNLPNCVNLVEVAYGDKTLVDMTQLCNTLMRNNPDRVIVGEIRSKEALAASQIASSTSGGFWTTGHAGDINNLRTRLFGMFNAAGVQLPREFLDEIIGSMFHFLVFVDKEELTKDKKRTLMTLVENTPQGYRTIIRFDHEEFAQSFGKTRRWVYENTISKDRLAMLAFRGGEMKPEYEQIKNRYLYCQDQEGGVKV